jgi:hypothetical protein
MERGGSGREAELEAEAKPFDLKFISKKIPPDFCMVST